MRPEMIETCYELARERYAEIGIDTEAAMDRLSSVALSLQCWQGDDVSGFEGAAVDLSDGGIKVTGSYPGRPRTLAELRKDLKMAFSLIPGAKRLNLHACYLDNGGQRVERNEIGVEHFESWFQWGLEQGLVGMDFNPTFFGHPKAAEGFTLSHPDKTVRDFWIEHGRASRTIAAAMGRRFGSPSICNIWIPDGYKDIPADRRAPRERLLAALDEVFAESFEESQLLDSLEGKLFGIGSESYVVGSHDFYLAYAIRRGKLLCLDSGHFHPTEDVGDKISAVLCFVDRLLLHLSRPVRWDSDHVVIVDERLQSIMSELVRGRLLDRVHLAMDFFDASINRVAAWVIGARSVLRALLAALLEPVDALQRAEMDGDWTARLALMEEYKQLPSAAVWDFYCLRQDVPVGLAWLDAVHQYERNVLATRK
jgi:L-rhamnose isomerase